MKYLDLHPNSPMLYCFPKNSEYSACYMMASGHGWMLMRNRHASTLFFHNPSTRQRISIPFLPNLMMGTVFSAPPTSPDCVVYTNNYDPKRPWSECHISSLRVHGDRAWTKDEVWSRSKQEISPKLKSMRGLCIGGIPYFVEAEGRVVKYDEEDKHFKIVPMAEDFNRILISDLVRLEGENIYAVCKKEDENREKIYQLVFQDGLAAWRVVADVGTTYFLFRHVRFFSDLDDKLYGLRERLQGNIFVAWRSCGPSVKYTLLCRW